MIPRMWILLAAVVLITGCSESEIGQRYRGEKALFWADRVYGDLVRHPGRGSHDVWMTLADRYEAIAREHLDIAADPRRPASLEIRELAALALFRSAQIHAALHDSLWVERVFAELAESFESAPGIAGEVWLARGRAAELREEWEEAIRSFEIVVRDVGPEPESPGVAGAVLDLPLRILRIRTRAGSAEQRSEAADMAEQYYSRHAAPGRPDVLRAHARLRLARLLGERGKWDEATTALDELEAWLRKQPRRPPLEPVRVALEGLESAQRAGAPLRTLVERTEALLSAYRPTETTLLACLHLARWHVDRQQLADALTWVDRGLVGVTETTIRAEALLLRAQILDRLDRPVEAYHAYRLVQSEYSISEPALRSHVELARHFGRSGDPVAREQALERAERELRAFIERYPRGSHTAVALEHLVTVLEMRGDHEAAVDELLRLGDHVRGTSREPALLVRAARKCETDLRRPERAATILDRVAEGFPATRIGSWAASEALRLRGSD